MKCKTLYSKLRSDVLENIPNLELDTTALKQAYKLSEQ